MINEKNGSIINIASMYGRIASFHNPILAYNTTKGAVPNMTRGMAQEWAEYGITVNAIAPGFIQTEMTDSLPDKVKEATLQSIPLKRFGTPEDVANTACFLASEAAAYITGQVIQVDGGMLM